ncbi:MAG: HTTM domain-containing protein [Flavobacteriaceae bacterium]|nr:HTTM domain-containing protein [Flavobacteriaceae bacterium]
MLFSTIRYIYMGWVDTQLVDPILHFSYFGFDWIEPLPRLGMYAVFGLLILSSVGILLGYFYRVATVLFFFAFTYVELIDITYYLNHYYFVSIVSFLLIWLPANQNYSLDVLRKPTIGRKKVSAWCIDLLKLQIAIVYIYAGLFKINTDWLLEALPLAIWLPAKTSIPIIGGIFQYQETAYLFSWMGMLFDTFVVFALLFKPTRVLAYIAVVVFHTLTGILFQIGVFPLVMMLVVTIFFPATFHERILNRIFKKLKRVNSEEKAHQNNRRNNSKLVPLLAFFMLFQLLFPWRYLLYPGNIFWTEEGYRFSWRVMLMEKAGTATFYVKDGDDGREGSVINSQFLNDHQEKQMAMQPDLILQFAHYLESHFKDKGMKDPKVRAEVWVTLNGRRAQLLIDPKRDLTKEVDGWKTKDWILPLKQ